MYLIDIGNFTSDCCNKQYWNETRKNTHSQRKDKMPFDDSQIEDVVLVESPVPFFV